MVTFLAAVHFALLKELYLFLKLIMTKVFLVAIFAIMFWIPLISAGAGIGTWKFIPKKGAEWTSWDPWSQCFSSVNPSCNRSRHCDTSVAEQGGKLICAGEANQTETTACHCEAATGGCEAVSGTLGSGAFTLGYNFNGGTYEVNASCVDDGWTVIQSRGQFGNPEDYFFRGWDEYVKGFGEPGKEIWLGLDHIHRLTTLQDKKLRVQMSDQDGDEVELFWNQFRVMGAENNYTLLVDEYQSGNLMGNGLSAHNGTGFSTFDSDRDTCGCNCANNYKGGHWYTKCHSGNPNGLNLNDANATYAKGIVWNSYRGYHHSLKTMQMAIKNV